MVSSKQLSKFRGKALRSTVGSAKLVAIALSASGHVITSAANMRGGGNVSKWTTHAEEALLKKLIKIAAKNRYGQITVIVARWSTKNGWSMAKPCSRCSQLLISYGAKEVYYTNQKGEVVRWNE